MDDKFFDNIDCYADRFCSEVEMSEFLEHIQVCEKCKKEYELALEIKKALTSMPQIEPPADFSDMLNDRLDDEIQRSRIFEFFRAPHFRYPAAIACLAIVAVVGVKALHYTDHVTNDDTYLLFDDGGAADNNAERNNNPYSSKYDVATPNPTVAPVNPFWVELNKARAQASASAAPKILPKAAVEQKEQKTVVPVVKEITAKPTSAPSAPKPTSAPAEKTAEPVASTVEPVAEQKQEVTEKPENNIPSYMDPREHVVLSSSVEGKYPVSEISNDDIPVKPRDLQAEFALLENPRTGSIIANPANIAAIEGLKFKDTHNDKAEYGLGSGSIFVSEKDKRIVDELLEKYVTQSENNNYYFTSDNFKSFTDELNNIGISYQEHFISTDNDCNVVFSVVYS